MLANRLNKTVGTLIGILAGLAPGAALADYATGLQTPASPVAHLQFDLHNTVLWISLAIGAAVLAVTLYTIIRFRKSKGAKAATFHEHLGLEITWTIIPFIILIVIAIPATKALIQMHDVERSDITIKATGYQWKWKYDYPDEGIGFVSNLSTPKEQIYGDAPKGEHYLLEVDNPVVIPVGKKIRFLTTSNDVIHSFYVPELGIKKDSIPGFVNETWTMAERPGIYRGQCAELCGEGHGFMPVVVKAVPEAEYRIWVATPKSAQQAQQAAAGRVWEKEELMARGSEVYAENCLMCHGDQGQGNPELLVPGLKGSKIATGPADGHIKLVMFGVEGTSMAGYRELLNNVDVAAVVTFERNSWGNNTGDVVQPSAIGAAQ